MDAKNQYNAIHEKFAAILNGFKKRLPKKGEGDVVPPSDRIPQAKAELLKSIHLSQIEVGRTLQEAREEAKISLEDAEASLRIKKEYLIALESGNFGLLPGTTYVSGFLKSYTQYLGVNINPSLLNVIPSNSNSPNSSETILSPLPTKKSTPSLVILAISMVATGGGYFAWYSFENYPSPRNINHQMLTGNKLKNEQSISSKENKDPSLDAPKTEKALENAKGHLYASKEAKNFVKVQENLKFKKETRLTKATKQVAKEKVKTSIKVLQQQIKKPIARHKKFPDTVTSAKKSDNKVVEIKTSPISDATGKINIKASEDTWIEIQDARKKIVFSRIITEGETIKLKYEKGLSLSTGNTRALLITHNNRKFIGFDKNDRISKNNQLNRWQE